MTASHASHKPSGAPDALGNGMGGSRGKNKLKVIGQELPDIDTDEQFAANWKITKEKEVDFENVAPDAMYGPLARASSDVLKLARTHLDSKRISPKIRIHDSIIAPHTLDCQAPPLRTLKSVPLFRRAFL